MDATATAISVSVASQALPAPDRAGSGADFLTLREALGLTREATAVLLDVREHVVKSWERIGAPLGAMRTLRDLDQQVERQVDSEVEAYATKRMAQGAPIRIRLVRYSTMTAFVGCSAARAGLPHLVHCALLGRLHGALRRMGAEVEIVWDHEVKRPKRAAGLTVL